MGCAERVSSPVDDNGERSALEQRTLDLKISVMAAGGMTDAQRRELADLVSDISAWQARTGRSDISVKTPGSTTDRANLAVRGVTPTDPGPCTPCAPVTASGGRICFLSYEGACDTSGGLTTKVCVYVCITVDPGATPIKSR